jgi:predicted acyltransferase
MILVVSPGSWDHRYAQLLHADWYGWTLADMVFPVFLFAVGVAIIFSFSSHFARGTSRHELMLKVLRRSAIILFIGLVLNAFPTFDFANLRIPGILQRIAACYAMAGLLCLAFWRREKGGSASDVCAAWGRRSRNPGSLLGVVSFCAGAGLRRREDGFTWQPSRLC